jgi:hypothetical protein
VAPVGRSRTLERLLKPLCQKQTAGDQGAAHDPNPGAEFLAPAVAACLTQARRGQRPAALSARGSTSHQLARPV